jgi:hypothetical protein
VSIPFTLEFIGGEIQFGSARFNVMLVPVPAGGTNGQLSGTSPPKISCTSPQPVTLAGSGPFLMRGTTNVFGPWEVEFAFPGPPFFNQGNLDIAGIRWELTGRYVMTVTDVATGERCSQAVSASGEYQLAGPALGGWPHDCSTKPSDSPGSSPGLEGLMVLEGHSTEFPEFLGGGACSPTLASRANSLIGKTGFVFVTLNYKLTY